jgi:hypothetical protein
MFLPLYTTVLQANRNEMYFIARGLPVQTENIVYYFSTLVITSNNGITIILINKD